MDANETNKDTKIIYKDLSYKINGILFSVHNSLGRFYKEKQYADAIEVLLKDNEIYYMREKQTSLKNTPDFIIENKIILELKTEPFILKDHYNQVQRYLQDTGLKLGLLANFRSRYLKPIRIIRINS